MRPSAPDVLTKPSTFIRCPFSSSTYSIPITDQVVRVVFARHDHRADHLEDGTVRRRREREARERGIVARAHTWSQRVHEVAGYGVAVALLPSPSAHAAPCARPQQRRVAPCLVLGHGSRMSGCRAVRLELGHAQYLIAPPIVSPPLLRLGKKCRKTAACCKTVFPLSHRAPWAEVVGCGGSGHRPR